MRVLQLFFLGLVLLSACNQNNRSDDIIEEQKMVRVLTDLHVMDGYMSTLMYIDTMRITGKNYYATVYKKHQITKSIFEKSLKYYSMQPVLLDSMYSQVENILKKKEDKLNKIQEKKLKKIEDDRLKKIEAEKLKMLQAEKLNKLQQKK